MNSYLIKSKVDLIREAKNDFLALYNEQCYPFTRKTFFYFFIQDDKKYIHKKSLNFVYTNANCYIDDVDPSHCSLTKHDPVDVCSFLETYKGKLLPKLIENNPMFFVYEFYEGDPITSINKEDFFFLKEQHESLPLTPFYNSMTYNIVRGKDGLKLVDFKHFEEKDTKPFFVYMYNELQSINHLFVEEGTDINPIVEHLEKDYPVAKAEVYTYC